MNLLIDGKSYKVNNFVDYLIENYSKKGKTYQIELEVQDKYDRKLIDKRKDALENNLLIFMNDEFEIVDQSGFNDYNKFIAGVGDLFSDEVNDKIDKKKYKNNFVKYDLSVVDRDEKFEFSFYYLDLNA